MNRLAIAIALTLSHLALSPPASAQATECGSCQSGWTNGTTVTTGDTTAYWAVDGTPDGVCKARQNGPCMETSGCSSSAGLAITGGSGGNDHDYSFGAHETDQGVAVEDLDADDLVTSGVDSTGTAGHGPQVAVSASCGKSGVIVINVLGGTMTNELRCDSCPVVEQEQL